MLGFYINQCLLYYLLLSFSDFSRENCQKTANTVCEICVSLYRKITFTLVFCDYYIFQMALRCSHLFSFALCAF